MKLLILTLVALLGAIIIGVTLNEDPGLVTIQLRSTTVQTSFAFAVAAIFLGFCAFYLAARLLGAVLRSPRRLRHWQTHRREHKSQLSLHRGLLRLAQGHWQRAEKELARSAEHSDAPTLGLLSAAKAAQARGDAIARNHYLQLAAEQSPSAQLVVDLTQAQMLIAEQHIEPAMQLLHKVQEQDPKNSLLLKLLKECYLALNEWKLLAELAPRLVKYGAASKDEAAHLEHDAYAQLLARAAHEGDDTQALDVVWRNVPAPLQRMPSLLAVYVRFLIERGESGRPESLLRNALERRWHPSLVYLYGFTQSEVPNKQLDTAEKWLKKYPADAILLLTLGRLCLRQHLRGKARSCLEASADIDPRPETYMLLGTLSEQTGDNTLAGEFFRTGLNLTLNPGDRTEKNLAPLQLPKSTIIPSLPGDFAEQPSTAA